MLQYSKQQQQIWRKIVDVDKVLLVEKILKTNKHKLDQSSLSNICNVNNNNYSWSIKLGKVKWLMSALTSVSKLQQYLEQQWHHSLQYCSEHQQQQYLEHHLNRIHWQIEFPWWLLLLCLFPSNLKWLLLILQMNEGIKNTVLTFFINY